MTEIITSPHNDIIKLAGALKQKKYRDKHGLFMIEGARLAEEGIKSGWTIFACLYTEEAEKNKRIQAILELVANKGCRMILIPSSIYNKITDTEQPQGIMLLIEKRVFTIEELLVKPSTHLIVVLDGLQDPGNVGTVIRTADAVGCSGVITIGSADLFAAKTVRASMGSLFHVSVIESSSRSGIIASLRKARVNILATALDSSTVYFEADLRKAVAVIFGNEGQGVSDEMLAGADGRLNIPIYGQAESLNVAVSSAVILYEALRQRRG